MKKNYESLIKSVKHLQALDATFSVTSNFSLKEDSDIYEENFDKFSILSEKDLAIHDQLYSSKDRQMILADVIEYIFLGRGFYSIKGKERDVKLGKFIAMLLHFVNILMIYETITVDDKLRTEYLKKLEKEIPEIANEPLFKELKSFKGKVGLPAKVTDAKKELNKYFDTILPKTAGGLWHELLVYSFLLRHNLGYIVPLILHQKFLRMTDTLVPPDFLIITSEKDVYGIEVGTEKERQSGFFSLMTNIPTATLDTVNSRTSDRCPICRRWIPICPKVIDDFSDLSKKLDPFKNEIRCLTDCDRISEDDKVQGKCPYMKYSRSEGKTLEYTKIEFADGYHYHYACVLAKINARQRKLLIDSKDGIALKTHYPYYAGLEMLFH